MNVYFEQNVPKFEKVFETKVGVVLFSEYNIVIAYVTPFAQ